MKSARVAAMLLSLLIPTVSGSAQNTPGDQNKEILATGGVISSLLAAPVTGRPYSAVQVHKTSRELADGTTISHKGHHFVARDSEGRVRVERRLARGSKGEPDTVMVFVMDPVAHTFTIWVAGPKVNNKTAVVVKIPASRKQDSMPPPNATAQAGPQPVITTQNLGMDSMQGVPVSVVKTTTIVPVGRSGNSAPITKTREVWTSPDLKLVMKEQWQDPRSGVRTVELDKFSQAEPDQTLFQPPPGYAVKTVLESLKELENKLSERQN